MASIRSLKKDIDLLLSLVLEDCMYVMEHYPEADKEKVNAIAREVMARHRDLRAMVNHPDGKENPAVVKEYMRSVVNKLYDVADQALEQLLSEVKK
ncbi:MAG: hypothetical protein KA780_01845 [Prolixibacteraceae bacterium]|jgi:molybdopterin synthase catalytic subunit|nr:hypothetical protein [Prolixibacteraceae bacterium]NLX28484.1 hypothetical protein [Bacteroidales bacterium]HNQ37992.1 hypothetical protein [Prolixibacteraceae bacterium]HOY50527.1 hypothetical protein [Prolixibacteraceae bacterium]HPJ78436.1 hypothetical protein [Prolixibacteraceae bacterium]